VENIIRTYFNQRISLGWSYSNFENIDVPVSNENSLVLVWLPDGSLRASGYLNASFTHVMGTRAYGVKLDAGVVPRYGRMYHLAYFVRDNLKPNDANRAALKTELNENYACECLHFDIRQDGLTVFDDYAGRAIAE